MRVCIFQFSALTVNRKYYCSHRTQKNSLHLRAGLATGICSWIFPPLPLTPVPQYRYFYWVLWMQNCADIWVESKCLRGKIHSIISCSNTSFSVPIWKLWALLQPAPFDRRTQQMSAGMVVVFPVMLLYPESELCTLLPDPWPAGLAGDIGRDWYNSAVRTVTRTTEIAVIFSEEKLIISFATESVICFYPVVLYFAGWCQSVILSLFQGKDQFLSLVRTFMCYWVSRT